MTSQPDPNALRRQRILEASAQVFKEKGLAKASMRAIAQEAGCTTGAIYPLFSGKEDIYGHLLKESLTNVYSQTAMATAKEADALQALEAGTTTFFHYYLDSHFEFDLGMYLVTGTDIKGLGKEQNEVLNECLLQTLDIFKACFIRLAPDTVSGVEAEAWATAERDAHFATLIGILMLGRTGRDLSIGSDAKTIFQNTMCTLKQRFN